MDELKEVVFSLEEASSLENLMRLLVADK